MSKHAISPGGHDSADGRERPAPDIPSGLREDGTDWARVLAMTDEEAYQNALADEDSQPMTPQQLARMRRAPNPRAIRDRLGLTQKEFARQFQITVGTLRDWEQGLHVPDSTATAFLRVIERDPEAVRRALHPSASENGIEVHAGTQARPWSNTNDMIWSGIEAARTATAEMQVTLDLVERAA